MKKILISMIILCGSFFLVAQEVNLTIDFTGFVPNEGTVNIIVVNEENTKSDTREPFFTDSFKATSADLQYTMTLPEGYYFISVFQDLNENKELDLNFLRIPKEPIGMSNYDFKGIPGGFDKQKVYVSPENNRIQIAVRKI